MGGYFSDTVPRYLLLNETVRGGGGGEGVGVGREVERTPKLGGNLIQFDMKSCQIS